MKTPLAGLCFLLLFLVAAPYSVHAAVHGVSLVAPAETELHLPIGDSIVTDYTPDGRHLVFLSAADNVVPGVAPSGYLNVYVRDQWTAITRLVTGEAPGSERVFYRDLLTGQTLLLGRELPEFEGWSRCEQPAVAADGTSAVFQAVTLQQRTLYRADLKSGITRQVDEPLAEAAFSSRDATLSADGRRIAFISNHPLLVPEDLNANDDVFVRDIVSNTIWLVSANTNGIAGSGAALDAAMSADGRWVVFSSTATDLIDGVVPGSSQVYLRDLETQTTLLVSRQHSNHRAVDGTSDQVTISSDGRYMGYRSSAATLTSGDDNGNSDVFLFDRLTGVQTLVSASRERHNSANGPSYRPLLSRDGSILVFKSYASDLIEHDYNQAPDLFYVSSSNRIAANSSDRPRVGD